MALVFMEQFVTKGGFTNYLLKKDVAEDG